MSQSLALVLVHIIFSTKNRIAFLRSPDLRSEVHAYLTATMRGLACEPVRVGGVGDHVHILTALSRGISLAELVKNLKTSSTGHGPKGWLEKGPSASLFVRYVPLHFFYGYSVFSPP
jgi:REP element-mobilizing transposase RayT